MDNLVKQDINFLENPLWKLSGQQAKELIIDSYRGQYILRTGYKLTESFDMLILLYLLKVSQSKSYCKNLELTRREILINCDQTINQNRYDRLEDSLTRWKNISIKFAGTFYDNKEYLVKSFGIINQYEIDKKTKKLKLQLNDSFMEMLKGSNFYKYIDFNEYKKLPTPVSRRLYELLSKNFKERDEWKIEAFKLAQKLTLTTEGKRKLYPSDIKTKMTSSINEINKETDLNITFTSYKNDDDETIFIFKLANKTLQEEQILNSPDTQTLIELLKDGYKDSQTLVSIIKQYYTKYGFGYVQYNILYANQKASKAYVGFLKQALKENWGDELKIENDKKIKANQLNEKELELKQQEEREEKIQAQKDEERLKTILEYFNSLNKMEFQRIVEEVIDKLPAERKNIAKDPRIGFYKKKLSLSTIATFLPEIALVYEAKMESITIAEKQSKTTPLFEEKTFKA